MSIGIFVVALFMLTMPGICKIKDNDFESVVQTQKYFMSTSVTETISDFTDISMYEMSPRTTTMTMVPYNTTVSEFPNGDLPRKLTRNKADMVESIWPVKHAAEMNGDLILGGLMMVHEREDTVTCGPIMPQGGIQALETMLYTLDVINNMGLLPNITVGAHILDDCDKDAYGLEMAVDFIKGE